MRTEVAGWEAQAGCAAPARRRNQRQPAATSGNRRQPGQREGGGARSDDVLVADSSDDESRTDKTVRNGYKEVLRKAIADFLAEIGEHDITSKWTANQLAYHASKNDKVKRAALKCFQHKDVYDTKVFGGMNNLGGFVKFCATHFVAPAAEEDVTVESEAEVGSGENDTVSLEPRMGVEPDEAAAEAGSSATTGSDGGKSCKERGLTSVTHRGDASPEPTAVLLPATTAGKPVRRTAVIAAVKKAKPLVDRAIAQAGSELHIAAPVRGDTVFAALESLIEAEQKALASGNRQAAGLMQRLCDGIGVEVTEQNLFAEATRFAVMQRMYDGGYRKIGIRPFKKSGGAVRVSTGGRTCFADASVTVLHHLCQFVNKEAKIEAIYRKIQRHGKDQNAIMSDVLSCFGDYDCNCLFVPADPGPTHSLRAVLKRDDTAYLLAWGYVDENGRCERHMSAWLADERQLIDNDGTIVEFDDSLNKKELKSLKKTLFPTGKDVHVAALYRCTKM